MNVFLTENDELVKTYNGYSVIVFKKLNCEPIYSKKTFKTNMRSYGDEVTNFHTRKISKPGADYIWLVGNIN